MKNRILLLMAMLLMASTAVWAQDDMSQRRERMSNINIAEVYNRQAQRWVKQLKLKKDKEDLFTVLFLDWQNARHNAVNPNGGDAENRAQMTDYEKASDEDAMKAIQDNFARQEKQVAVDREYLPKFLEMLTPQQAAQLFLNQQARRTTGNGGFPMGGMRGGGGFGGGGFGGGGRGDF